jgi:hypothetical protein
VDNEKGDGVTKSKRHVLPRGYETEWITVAAKP